MKKIVTIVGARPQFIKTPLISAEIRKFAKEIIIHTGQHYDGNMSDVFFDELGIPRPDYNLEVGSGLHGHQTAQMLVKIEDILNKEKPDMVIVYGDTNSTLAGALAAAKLNIPVAHVEAGLRSYNRAMPEEINRIVADHLSELLFCPTKSAADILQYEGITKNVHVVGDVMADIQIKIRNPKSEIRKGLELDSKQYYLATVHRQENTDDKKNLKNIIDAFNQLDLPVVWPIHPRTKKYLDEYDLNSELSENIKIIFPTGLIEMANLEANAKMILTDSGGVQKEAYLHEVPCVTLRNETEWVETVKSGWNKLAGTDTEKIVDTVKNFKTPSEHPNIFGDGKAYEKIGKIIREFLT